MSALTSEAGAPAPPEEDQPARKRPKLRRTTFACYRCHRRKIKCDGMKPACSNCVQAKQPCNGILDGQSKIEIPRSIVKFLTDRIKEKERLLEKLGVDWDNGPAMPLLPGTRLDSSPGVVDLDGGNRKFDLASEAFSSFTNDFSKRIIDCSTKFPCGTFLFASSRLPSAIPLPVDGEVREEYRSKTSNALDQIPHNVKERLVALYIDKLLPSYPFVEGHKLWAQFHRVQAGETVSEHDIFVVSMMIAISMMTSKASGKVASVSQRVFSYALQHTESLWESSLQNLQGILFLSQYSCLMPMAARVWDTTGLGIRMALELGLHRDPEETLGDGLLESEKEERRCLFWTLYIFDRSMCATTHRRFGLADDSISTKYPNKNGSFLINVQFRRIQSELWTVLYLRRGRDILTEPGSFEAWTHNMESRIKAWEKVVHEKSSWASDWYSIAAAHGLIFLHRPTPRNPYPSAESLLKCFEAATRVASGYWRNIQEGLFAYLYHAVHDSWEAAICMLWTIRHCREQLKARYGIQKLVDTMNLFSSLGVLMTKRWPQAKASLESYERSKAAVMRELMSPQATSPVRNDELDRLILPYQALINQAAGQPGMEGIADSRTLPAVGFQRGMLDGIGTSYPMTSASSNSRPDMASLYPSEQQDDISQTPAYLGSVTAQNILPSMESSFPTTPEFLPNVNVPSFKNSLAPDAPVVLGQNMDWDETFIQPDASGFEILWSM